MARTHQLVPWALSLFVAINVMWGQTTTAGSGGGAPGPSLPFTYNQGSTKAVTQTGQAKLQQYLSIDDFGDNSGNPVSPSSTAAVNTVGIQNAINYASALGIILTCQGGPYQINNSLTILNGTMIFGHGEGNTTGGVGCTIQQTTANPVWVIAPHTDVEFQFQDMIFDGNGVATYGIYMAGTDVSHYSAASDLKMIRTHWNNLAGPALYLNSFAFIQDMYTEYNWFNGGGAGTSCWKEISTGGGGGYIVSWESHHDTWQNCDVAWDLDTPNGGHSGSWDVFTPRFVGIFKTPVVVAGQVMIVNIYDWSWEQINKSDPSPIITSTCTTSGANATTVTTASTGFVNGQYLTIQAGNTNQTYGGSNPGWDFQTQITAGGGTTTLTVATPIPLQVSAPYNWCTNAQYDGWTFIKSPVSGNSPTNISFHNGLNIGADRYSIDISHAANVTFENLAANGIIYDPNAYASGNFVQVDGSRTFAQVRTALPISGSIGVSPARFYDGNIQVPVFLRGNPGTNGGFLLLSCSDVLGPNNCGGAGGNYGPLVFRPNNVSGQLTIYSDPGTFTTWFGKNGWPANGNHVIIGNGNIPTGSANDLTLAGGTCPSGGTANQGTFCVTSGGILNWVQASGVQSQIGPPIVTATNGYFPAGGTVAIVCTSPIYVASIIPTANVTSSTITGQVYGNLVIFDIQQPSSGGPITWTWPANVLNGGTIGMTANKHNIQQFFYSSSGNYYAISSMLTNQ